MAVHAVNKLVHFCCALFGFPRRIVFFCAQNLNYHNFTVQRFNGENKQHYSHYTSANLKQLLKHPFPHKPWDPGHDKVPGGMFHHALISEVFLCRETVPDFEKRSNIYSISQANKVSRQTLLAQFCQFSERLKCEVQMVALLKCNISSALA